MSYKSKGSSLPPLEDTSLSGRSPRQRRRKTSYEYKSGSSSPNTPSPRSPFDDKDSPRQRNAETSKRSPRTSGKDVNKEFRTLCIGSPIPDTDPHAEDMVLSSSAEKKANKPRNKGHRTPSITIDKVEELHLADSKSPRGGRPVSPASYELIERSRTTTPFSKSKSNERLLSIEPSTPPVERKGNRQVINYYRDKDDDVNRSKSDGNLPHSARESRRGIRGDGSRKHTRSRTEENRSEMSQGSRDKSPALRDMTSSPRLTSRARENEQSFSSGREKSRRRRQQSDDDDETESSSPDDEDRQRREQSDRQAKTRNQRSNKDYFRRDDDDDSGRHSPPQRNRRRNRKYSNESDSEEISPRTPREEIKKPVRLEPLKFPDKKK